MSTYPLGNFDFLRVFDSDSNCVPKDSIPHLEDHFELSEVAFKISALISAPGFECPKLDENKFYTHPLFLIQQNQIPGKTIQTDASKCKEWLSAKFHIPDDKVKIASVFMKITTKYWDHLDETLRFYACIWQKPHMLERVKRFMVAREYAHVQAQRRNPRTFLWWNENIFSRRNLTGRATILENLLIGTGIPLVFLGIVSYANTTIPTLAFVIAAIAAVAYITFGLVNLYVARRQEKEADIRGLEITKDKEAAQLFFEALDKSQRESSYTLVRWIFKPIEYLLGDKSLEDRFTYLKIDHTGKK